MKYKVDDLDGALLDAAVAKARGYEVIFPSEKPKMGTLLWQGPNGLRHVATDLQPAYSPSTDWGVGGPIIERECVELQLHACSDGWWAGIRRQAHDRSGGVIQTGATPLIAAMRAYVASKFGDEVEL